MSVSLAQFVEYVSQTGLVSPGEMSSYLDAPPPDQRPKDAEELAKALIRDGKLTKYLKSLDVPLRAGDRLQIVQAVSGG